MNGKTIDGLMRHLRNSGIDISGSKQKRQLINSGYYHGYKGYRFFKISSKKIPFTMYSQIDSTIKYDEGLKALFYPKIMYIETALKNIALNTIVNKINSSSIQKMYDTVVQSYHNCDPSTSPEYKNKHQKKKFRLQSIIHKQLSKSYDNQNPKIAHFYNNSQYNEVPIWAIFEVLSMGDFGFLLSCLDKNIRTEISHAVGLDLSSDTNVTNVYKYVYALKGLRNAIAHNDIVYDTRFNDADPSKPMIRCLTKATGLPYVNFESIGDYVILMCYFLKLLEVPKTEIRAFIREFERLTDSYRAKIDLQIQNVTLHPDLSNRMQQLKRII